MYCYCAQHDMHHSLVACKKLSAAEAEEKEAWLDKLAEQVSEIHYSTNLGYGDEGNGYDYKEQVRLLIEAGWSPPKEKEND